MPNFKFWRITPIKLEKACWLLFLNFLLSTVWADCGPRGSAEKVEILIWNGYSWAGFTAKDFFPAPNYLGHNVDKQQWNCPVDCRYTVDKKKVATVDAVIFEAQPITSYMDDYKRHPPYFPHKFSGQQWISFGYETHFYFQLYGDPGFLSYVDANMTFYQDAAVPITFTCNWAGGEFTDILKPPPPKKQDKCIAMAATNCQSAGATFRTAYAKELMEYIEIDSFGQCLHNKDPPPEMQFALFSNFSASLRNKVKLFKDYKFVLTMENNNVTDYVTEKMMNVFQAGSVPIYMGAPNVEPDWVPGERSIIKTSDFSGPKELAEYLKHLCNNDEDYYSYFEWKKKGFSKEFQEKMDNCVFYGAECRLCQYLLEQRKKMHREEIEVVDKRKDKAEHSFYALNFAAKQFIQVVVDSEFDVHDGFTLSAWVLLKDKLDNPILARGDVIKFGIKRIWKRGYAELCVLRECYYGSHPIILGSWTHVAVTYDWKHRTVKFYGNGMEDEAVSIPFTHIESDHYQLNPPLVLATSAQKRDFFSGRLDNVSFWNKALDTDRAKKLVYGVYDASADGIVAFWSFDQPPGSHSKVVDDIRGLVGEIHGVIKWEESFSKPLVTTGPCL